MKPVRKGGLVLAPDSVRLKAYPLEVSEVQLTPGASLTLTDMLHSVKKNPFLSKLSNSEY
jgi:hypothetical protein